MISLRPDTLFAGIILVTPLHAGAQSADEVLDGWLATNAQLRQLRVDFVQIRKLRTLKTPSQDTGRLWLDRTSGRFRWQVGQPPETIVIGDPRETLIARPKQRKFERRPAGAGGAPGMAVLAKGFPRTREEFQKRFRLTEVLPDRDAFRIEARPLGKSARGVSSFVFVVGADRHRLRAIEIRFRDRSSQEIRFTEVALNPRIPAGTFALDLAGYREGKF